MIVVYIVLALILEFFISIKFITILGFVWSLVWIFATILIGILLLKYSHYKLISEAKNLFDNVSVHRFYQNSKSFILASGLLILPGLLSDILGCFALVFAIYLQFAGKIHPKNNDSKGEKDVIDVEVIEDTADKHFVS